MTDSETLEQQLDRATEKAVREALAASGGSPTKAAVLLGVSRQTVYRYIERFGITRRVVLDEAA